MKGKSTAIIIGTIAAAFIAFILFAPEGKRTDTQKPNAAGAKAPDFNLTDTKGKVWRLSEMKGSVVVVNFWATWCPPCRSEMPSLSSFHTKSLDRNDMQVVTVLYNDAPEKAVKYFEQNKFSMPILVDPDSQVAKAYGLTGVPETFVLSREGVILEHIVGPTEFDTPEALAYFQSLR